MNPFRLDNEVMDFIRRTEALSADLPADASLAQTRAAFDRMCAAFARPMPAGLHRADGVLHAAGPDRTLRVRSYTTPDAVPGRVMLYFHGGGFVLGSLDSHDSICADLAAGGEVGVIALDYRLAPEHPFPAALDDAEAAYEDLIGSHQHVILGGDSAGGALVVALCLRLRAKRRPMPWAQLLIYPMLHPDSRRAMGTPKAEAPLFTSQAAFNYMRHYLGREPVAITDPEIMPLATHDFATLPPAAIFAADIDPLSQDAHDYAAALATSGVPHSLHPGLGLVHGFLRGRGMSARIAETFSGIVSALHGFAHSGRG
ncbi:alpha/beta hydrolase [Acidisoma sp. C75]